LPLSFHPEELIELDFSYIQVEQLWKGKQVWLPLMYVSFVKPKKREKFMETGFQCFLLLLNRILTRWKASISAVAEPGFFK
jgi:hypothetical protein